MQDQDKKDSNGDSSFDESTYVNTAVHEIEAVDPFSRAHQEVLAVVRQTLPAIIQEARQKIKNLKGSQIMVGKEPFFIEEYTLAALEEMIPALSDEEALNIQEQLGKIVHMQGPAFDLIEDDKLNHILGDEEWFKKEIKKAKMNLTPEMGKYELGSLINAGSIKTAQTFGLMDDMPLEEVLKKLEAKNTDESLRFALNLMESAKERQGIESSKQVRKDMRKIVGIEEKTEKAQTPKRPNSSSADRLRPSR